ncbi:hypothetical protein Hdeb2414_s0006g00196211 [Helianthus debilis subsp. tardiflorus]
MRKNEILPVKLAGPNQVVLPRPLTAALPSNSAALSLSLSLLTSTLDFVLSVLRHRKRSC